jgi:hypothetical protein
LDLENATTDILKSDYWTEDQKKYFLSYMLTEAQKGTFPVLDPDNLNPINTETTEINTNLHLIQTEYVRDCFYYGELCDIKYDDFDWESVRISSIERPLSLKERKPWLTAEDTARTGLFTYEQAAWEIAEKQEWDDGTFQEFLLDMAHAIQNNNLTIYRPKTGLNASPDTQEKWFVTIDSVNNWLDSIVHGQYKWERLSTTTMTSKPIAMQKDELETKQLRQLRRFQMCLYAGLVMPEDDYSPMPRGINKIAELENITRQAFTEDIKEHIRRTFMK